MKLGNKLKKLVSIDEENYRIKVQFTDGVSGELDLGEYFNKPKNLSAEIVKGQMFNKCYIESGALAWPNGFELCPDALRMKLKSKKSKAA
jgi:hypothetical protein